MSEAFAQRVLAWFDRHGRTDLPWQQDPTPYRVWVSEIMLQQTQVATVIPYYTRFMQRFPDVIALANAAEDDVLHHWSGLGYYARARNLHAAAKRIRDEFNGEFPQSFEDVLALPGIGRSTAGAVLSLSCGQRLAILDGNVKRVLARHAAIAGWPGKPSVMNALWRIAEDVLPYERTAHYNQAMMDLGATVCRRTRPKCDACPVASDCVARMEARQSEFPGRKQRNTLPERRVDMLLLEYSGKVLLEKRPPTGIWGGLWSLPESADGTAWVAENLPQASAVVPLESLTHTFSHFRLHIRPLHVLLPSAPAFVADTQSDWYDAASPQSLGLPAPVRSILNDFVERAREQMTDGVRDGTHG